MDLGLGTKLSGPAFAIASTAVAVAVGLVAVAVIRYRPRRGVGHWRTGQHPDEPITGGSQSAAPYQPERSQYVIPPVVDQAWVDTHPDHLVLADVRWYLDGRSGRAAYDAGHVPGAVFVDLDRVLAAPASPAQGRHPLPDPETFASGLAAAGIGDGDVVIGYDDAGGVNAARLVWMLRAIGHDAALLDGGLTAYDGALETAGTHRPPASFTPRPWPAERLADVDDARSGSFVVIDARERARYRGDTEPIDPRAGHIPGARNLPCRDNVDDAGRFLPVAELRRRFVAVGVSDGTSVVSYCGSGVTACHNLIALEHAGFHPGRLYPGSWSQYSADPARPAATGDQPGDCGGKPG